MTRSSERTVARWRGRQIAGVLVLLVAVLAGCAHTPPPPPQPLDVQVRVVAASDVNPNRNGRPSPVFLRVFELRDSSKFMNAQFDDVTLHADTTLAGTLIGREERIVAPGSTVMLALKIDPQTRLLGIVAEYSDLANSRWRATSPAPVGGLLTLFKDQSLVISLDRQAVSAAAVPVGKGK